MLMPLDLLDADIRISTVTAQTKAGLAIPLHGA